MKRTHILVTSSEIDLEYLAKCTIELGVIKEVSGTVDQCRLSRGNKHLWVYQDESLHEVYEDMNMIDAFAKALDGELPKRNFVLDLSSSNEDNELLLDFICKVSGKVKIAWSDDQDKLHSNSDISELCKLRCDKE